MHLGRQLCQGLTKYARPFALLQAPEKNSVPPALGGGRATTGVPVKLGMQCVPSGKRRPLSRGKRRPLSRIHAMRY